jgi:hypothetical protein
MITLFIAFLLFATQQPENSSIEYKILTTYESLYGNQVSGMVTQNGKFTEEIVDNPPPRSYLFDKPSEPQTRIVVDSMQARPLTQIGTIGGIRPAGVAGNDIMIETKINEMTAAGWELTFVTSGAGGAETMGMIVTKYIFKRSK